MSFYVPFYTPYMTFYIFYVYLLAFPCSRPPFVLLSFDVFEESCTGVSTGTGPVSGPVPVDPGPAIVEPPPKKTITFHDVYQKLMPEPYFRFQNEQKRIIFPDGYKQKMPTPDFHKFKNHGRTQSKGRK